MKTTLSVMVMLLAGAGDLAAASDEYPESLGRFVGDYVGQRTLLDGTVHPLVAHVIDSGDGRYMVRFGESRDLPSTDHGLIETGTEHNGRFELLPGMGAGSREIVQVVDGGVIVAATLWRGRIEGGVFSGSFAGREYGTFSLTSAGLDKYRSPTLGAKPPSGARVVFDGTSLDGWSWGKSPLPIWVLTDGAMQANIAGPNIRTIEEFGDVRLHIEFRSPFMPDDRGQARGNSGVYLQGRYEVQVLDSYGLSGESNECGGVYRVARPLTNMCAPPTHWQSYDIDFRAPRFDARGQKTSSARISVIHNGTLIIDDVELPGATGGAISQKEAPVGPLLLQNHNGDPVQFRNIWTAPLTQ